MYTNSMRGTLNQNACMLFDALHHDIFSFLCKTCKIIKKSYSLTSFNRVHPIGTIQRRKRRIIPSPNFFNRTIFDELCLFTLFYVVILFWKLIVFEQQQTKYIITY